MRKPENLVLIVGAAVVLGIVARSGYFIWTVTHPSPYRGPAFETREAASKLFRIRVTAYKELNGGILPGAYYVLTTNARNSIVWKEILTVRDDDPRPIPTDSVRVVDSQTGFFWMNTSYAVTRDAGDTWAVWDTEKELLERRHIKQVSIERDGTGKMTLYGKEVLSIVTTDYGVR